MTSRGFGFSNGTEQRQCKGFDSSYFGFSDGTEQRRCKGFGFCSGGNIRAGLDDADAVSECTVTEKIPRRRGTTTEPSDLPNREKAPASRRIGSSGLASRRPPPPPPRRRLPRIGSPASDRRKRALVSVAARGRGAAAIVRGMSFGGSGSVASGAKRPFEYGRTHVVRPKGAHKATIVWLHGLGDNGASWSQLLETLPLPNVSYGLDFKCASCFKLFFWLFLLHTLLNPALSSAHNVF
ncbi:hypothetical protein GUJ93_ZPchr0008g12110 [Zizania palustris]|uniref:Phospholipase/carboxylesterase/thioesterase domain-containing protein n=1 Tax=Zizania palustris TaxID=103762 RepID=A0A8J5RUT5_ZIZPA|nr:hypothetical protein GUJ93_ZPchr0008g12110 [Zizania palustris]